MTSNFSRIWVALLCLGASFSVPPTLAQTKGGTTVAEVAGLQGADRAQRLIAGARKEGTLTLYGSAPPDDLAVLTTAFEKKYGVKVRVWRASSETIVQRGVTEMRAGRNEADVFETNGPDMEALYREKVFQEVKSPYLADLLPGAVMPHREWVGTRLNVFVAAYNTRLVKKEELPRRFEDLLNPKWKGKLGIEASDFDWFATVASEIGEAKVTKLFREIVAANGLSVRKGHTLLTNLVVAGEVPLALTVYHYKAEQLKNNGAPIDWFILPPTVARFQGVGLARRAPHPHAAVLFFDFMLTDAQEILSRRDFTPASRKIGTSITKSPIKFVDPKQMLDEDGKWTRLYAEIVTRRAR
jgi:iron(III) transport system substrate-binding protein